jgi:3-isopropylmalate dehydratase small subunit
LIAAGGGGLAEGGIVAAVASAPAVVISGIGLAVAGAAAYIHYRNLKADLLTMEEAQARRERDIRELELSRANLEVALAQLSAESKSIVRLSL